MHWHPRTGALRVHACGRRTRSPAACMCTRVNTCCRRIHTRAPTMAGGASAAGCMHVHRQARQRRTVAGGAGAQALPLLRPPVACDEVLRFLHSARGGWRRGQRSKESGKGSRQWTPVAGHPQAAPAAPGAPIVWAVRSTPRLRPCAHIQAHPSRPHRGP